MENRIEVFDAGENGRLSASGMVEVGSPRAAPTQADNQPVAARLIVEERQPHGARSLVVWQVIRMGATPRGVRGTVHWNTTALVPHGTVHDFAHEEKIVFVSRRSDRTVQDRRGAIGCVPVCVDSPEVVDLFRIGLAVVTNTHRPLQCGERLEFLQGHHACQRADIVGPRENMFTGSVGQPCTRFDAGLVERHPFTTAARTTLEGKRNLSRVSRGVGLAVVQQELPPLGDELRLGGCGLRGIRFDRRVGGPHGKNGEEDCEQQQ